MITVNARQRLDQLDNERADDDGMAPSSFVVQQPDWATPHASLTIPSDDGTEDATLAPIREPPGAMRRL